MLIVPHSLPGWTPLWGPASPQSFLRALLSVLREPGPPLCPPEGPTLLAPGPQTLFDPEVRTLCPTFIPPHATPPPQGRQQGRAARRSPLFLGPGPPQSSFGRLTRTASTTSDSTSALWRPRLLGQVPEVSETRMSGSRATGPRAHPAAGPPRADGRGGLLGDLGPGVQVAPTSSSLLRVLTLVPGGPWILPSTPWRPRPLYQVPSLSVT